MYNTKSALECNLWNSGDKVSNVGLSIVTNIPLGRGGGMLIVGKATCVSVGGIWEISVPSS